MQQGGSKNLAPVIPLRERLSDGQPDLIVGLFLYPTQSGGRSKPIALGYGCPCTAERTVEEAWTGYPLLRDPMLPGERRRVGIIFLVPKPALAALSDLEKFYLWESRIIGEATIVR